MPCHVMPCRVVCVVMSNTGLEVRVHFHFHFPTSKQASKVTTWDRMGFYRMGFYRMEWYGRRKCALASAHFPVHVYVNPTFVVRVVSASVRIKLVKRCSTATYKRQQSRRYHTYVDMYTVHMCKVCRSTHKPHDIEVHTICPARPAY